MWRPECKNKCKLLAEGGSQAPRERWDLVLGNSIGDLSATATSVQPNGLQ